MNIGQTLRSLMGELRTGEARTLELRPGQIVRGVVGRVTPDQQATVTINGVTVQALLEAGLKPGEAALLQVQPPGADGTIKLKLAPQSSAGLPEQAAPMAQASPDEQLQQLGLSGSKVNRQAVQLLQEAGQPLTKAGIQAAADALRTAPQGASKEAWLDTVKLALAKGLPLSEGTLEALHSVTQGPGPDRAYAELAHLIRVALSDGGGSGKSGALLRELGRLLEQAAATVERGAQTDGRAGTGEAAHRTGSEGRSADGAGPAQASAAKPAEAGQAAAKAAAATNAGSAPPAEAAEAGTGLAKRPGLTGQEGKAGQTLPEGTALAASDETETGSARMESSRGTPAGPQGGRAEGGGWLSRMLTDLGVGHEHRIAHLPADSGPLAAEPAADSGRQTLKELLLQAVRQEDLPEPLKEAAGQALQQVTGQQLLLSGDRMQPLAHLTVMIPFYNEQGRQTAAVHVESRRDHRGELDADNCRLLFDLSMRTLGPLLIDVRVADRSVGIRVLNDHEKLAELLNAGKEEIDATMEAAGYRLSFLQTAAYPDGSRNHALSAGHSDEAGMRDPMDFYRTPYRGVDVRV